ncbi:MULTISPECIES: beta-N-acetylhexosaminidase [Paenibacillus]|uniref:beta-N-acetylhexosaminidase n=1 Tax=Paenibacillus TaxID=44249 RepID=UPI0022B8C1D0|nr:beta-N-acetylhexosaminidase [Paenibacillus caseinilyticus]MCZ8519255.1 beta-N-acetylhexosaminidase [Paenibacillus caseinilyticus]
MERSNLSLKQKIGQLLMCGFPGTEPDAGIEGLIREGGLGGIIYFRRNLVEPAQAAALSAKLQEYAAEGSGVPLLIAIDQEGGMVTRIERGVSVMPGAMALGATGDADAAYQAARVTAAELRAMGINMNFAPVLDVNNNPLNPVIGVRSYGGDADLVSRLGTAAVRGCQEEGVAATVKHFPGHGDTAQDSHHELPSVPHARERLDRLELAPFREAIRQGVDAVMTAHLLFPAVEPERLPATLSPRVLTGLLREELGYEGVIVTDCLEMNAIAKHYGVGEGAVLAVEAGADLVLVSHRLELQQSALNALIAAVENGRLTEERIDRSVDRLLALKARRAAHAAARAAVPQPGSTLATEASLALAERIGEASITLVAGELQPLERGKRVLVIWPEVRVGSEVDEVLGRKESLGYWLAQLGFAVREERIGVQPTAEERERVLALAREGGQAVAISYNAALEPKQAELIRELAGVPELRLTVASVRIPSDLSVLGRVPVYLACYENTPFAMKALARVLGGELPAAGILPAPIQID